MIMGTHNNADDTHQTEKKWAQLKGNTRAWIYAVAKKEHTLFVERHGKMPVGQDKYDLIDRVYRKIEGRDISVSFDDVKNNVGKFISIQNQKNIIPGSSSTC